MSLDDSDRVKSVRERFKGEIGRITVKEKIDHAQILFREWLTVDAAILSGDNDTVKSAVWNFLTAIPEELHDDQFRREINEAILEVTVDATVSWCGVRSRNRVMRTKQDVDVFLVKRAVVNLAHRLGYVARKIPHEVI